jgi:hypothetical protein
VLTPQTSTDEPVVPLKRGKAAPVDRLAQLPRSRSLEDAKAAFEALIPEVEAARAESQAQHARVMRLNIDRPDAAATAARLVLDQLTGRQSEAARRLADAKRAHADACMQHVTAHADDAKAALLNAAGALERECARLCTVADTVFRETGASSHKLFDATRRMRASLGSFRVALK